MDDLEDVFDGRDAISTPEVARYVGLSESRARALAAEIGVVRVGPAYAWNRDDVAELQQLLAPGENDEEDGEECDAVEEVDDDEDEEVVDSDPLEEEESDDEADDE